MLAIQIAAGIVLAAIVLKYWKQSLSLAIAVVAFLILGVFLLWLGTTGVGRSSPNPAWFAGPFWLIVIGYAIRQRRRRARIVRDGAPPVT